MQYLAHEHKKWCTETQLIRLKELLACQDMALLTKNRGGNSKVFCVEADGKRWAVKSYPPHNPAQRDRLAAEVTAYQFLNQQHVAAVPLLKAFCEKERWLVMSWIDGVLPEQYSSSDILQAVQFIQKISELSSCPEATVMLPPAAEACLSLNILLNQIIRRLERLMSLPEQDPDLIDFLMVHFLPEFEYFKQRAGQGFRNYHIDPDQELSQEKRSLIPADFGFHNAIRDSAGQLYFFDFDYFGWDDPVKLLSDILWHPKMRFSVQQEQQIIQGLTEIYKNDETFVARFSYTHPLFGLRWVLILLNEFIPEYWINRQHAEAYTDPQAAKIIQLQRAKDLLTCVKQSQRKP